MKGLILVFLLTAFNVASAQRFVDARLKIDFSYGISSGIGNAVYSNNSYTAPSLINNFKKGSAYGFTASYKLGRIWGVSMKVSQTNLSDWTYPGSTRYQGAEFSALAVNPQIVILMPFHENGIWNRINVSCFAGPSLNFSTLTLSTSPYFSPTTVDYDFKNSKAQNFGIAGGAKADLLLSNKLLVGVCYTIDYLWVSPTRFEANSIQYGTISFHVGFRYGYNARFKYQPGWFE